MLRGSALVFLARNFQKLVAALVIIILGRTLGREGVGTYGLLVQIISITTTLASLGLGPAHVHFRGQRRITVHQVLGNSLVGAGLFGLVAFFAFTLIRSWLRLELNDPLLTTLISFAFPVVMLQSYLDYLWIGEDRLGIYSGLMALRYVSLPALLLAAVMLPETEGGKFRGIALALFANAVISLGFNLFMVARVHGLGANLDLGAFVRTTRYGLHIQAGSVAQAIGYRFDYFLINYYLGTGSTGVYIVATNLAEFMWIIPSTVSSALLPRVSTHNTAVAQAVTARTCRIVFAVSLVAGAALWLLAELVLRLAFENRFLGAVTPLRILLVGTVLFSLQKVLGNYFIGQGKASWFLRATLLSMAVNLGINLVLIPAPGWGIAGAALASAVSYSLSTAVLAVLFVRWSGLRLRDILVPNRDDLAEAMSKLVALRSRASRLRHRGAVR